MDTSIIVVIAIVVVFVVAVPTMIRRSATELSRVDIDRVPDEARVIDADLQNPCRDHTARARVFHADTTVEPAVPRAVVEPLADRPQLRLSAPAPELSVIDGHAGQTLAEVTPQPRHEPESQRQSLPLAVGQARPAYLVDVGHGTDSAQQATASRPSNVHRLHPAVHAVFTQSGPGQSSPDRPGPAAHLAGPGERTTGAGPASAGADRAGLSGSDRLGGGAIPLHRGSRGSGNPGEISSAGAPSHTGRDLQTSKRNFGADEDLSMTENKTTLQESMSALGTMIRGFALVLLVSLLGILVTGVLTIFAVVHPALIGVFAGLSVVSLVIVRTLNLRKWEIKKQLRELDRISASSPAATDRTPPRPTTIGSQATAVKTSAPKTTASTVTAPKAARGTGAAPRATAATSTGASQATAAKPAQPSGSTKAAATGASTKATQARAVIERNASAKRAREEATTGEIPIVHIRSEAAAGHSTRQVLLTGPIPAVEDKPEKTEDKPEKTEDKPEKTEDKPEKTEDKPEKTEDKPEKPVATSTPTPAKAADAARADSGTGSRTPSDASADTNAAPTAGATAMSVITTGSESPVFTTDSEAPVFTTDSEADATAGDARSRTATDATVAAKSAAGTEKRDADQKLAVEQTADDAGKTAADASTGKARTVSDPFTQRLKARDAWSPTPLPVPGYVTAPEVEHPIPAATRADVASYEIESRSREDIAAQFAAELGYRPELSDSAREEGPLGHGRTAIRTSKAADLGAVNDVLARRRA
ncbi:hypothetical protein [Brevibacterium sp.]|uniref:hypothetical protein n=1 Tax=Brevibacterium sp. TaxID=1701 RepID=UPI002810CB53|nr:hypothetical protein [Brevibacterium sp.]